MPATNTAIAKQCLRIARRWSGERQQWGEPLGHHEAVAEMLGFQSKPYFQAETAAMEGLEDPFERGAE